MSIPWEELENPPEIHGVSLTDIKKHTVYLIMSGEYSDRAVRYATLDKDKAERFIRIENAKCTGCYDPYDIEEYLLDDFEIEEIPQDEWGIGYRINIDNGIIKIVSTREAIRYNNTYDKWNLYFYCDVWLKEPDEEKAKKIAYDMYMQKLAEDNGL